jgi:glycosyltransferase involved in cell wall biosynthesis
MIPIVSVITVTKNSGTTLEKTIKSVINQNFNLFEYIIIDGKSSDETVEIIKNYAKYISYWVSEPDGGIYEAMIKGLNIARGRFVLFLGSDDQLCPDILQKISTLLHDQNIVYYGNAFFSLTKEIYDGQFNNFKLAYQNICQQSIFYPRWMLKKYTFNAKYPILADYELNMRLIGSLKQEFQYLPYIIATYSQRGVSTYKEDTNFSKEKKKIIKNNFSIFVLVFYFLCNIPIIRSYCIRLLKLSHYIDQKKNPILN